MARSRSGWCLILARVQSSSGSLTLSWAPTRCTSASERCVRSSSLTSEASSQQRHVSLIAAYHWAYYNLQSYHAAVLKFGCAHRWTEENREIVTFDAGRATSAAMESELDAELRRLYKTPASTNDVVTNQTLGVELNRHNYVHKMHKLLQLEELTRSQIIAGWVGFMWDDVVCC